MTPLGRILAETIAAEGPITVERYMGLALGHPRHGYYATRDPFGVAGDFTTAPEISQMFGELLGLWAAEAWGRMGRPAPFRLVELGPGRGTLMADALRAGRVAPGFRAAADIHLVETSPVLRRAQQDALAQSGLAVAWHDRLEDVPAGPAIVLANEFLDALPIRQFVRAADGWHERLVGLAPDGGLVFGLAAFPVARAPSPLAGEGGLRVGEGRMRGARSEDPSSVVASRRHLLPQAEKGARGDIIEIGEAAQRLVESLAGRLRTDGGAALLVDYGHVATRPGDTLQAMRRHGYADPLACPGEQDLTAHVDFAALARAAARAGAAVHGPLPQGEFLFRIGIAARADRLRGGAPADRAQAVDAALARLTGTADGQMGALFKAMAIAHPDLDLPALERARPAAERPAASTAQKIPQDAPAPC